MKKFKTLDEQIELLKSRNLIFDNEKEAKNILLEHNYYNIINGYKDLFLDSNSDKEKFINGTTFKEIFALFTFDKNIKEIYLKYILKLENKLKSYIAYYFSLSYGNDNYLKLNSFDDFHENDNISTQKRQKRIKDIQDLISIINKEISNSIDTKDYIKHYMLKYGYVPPWIMINVLSFGQISKFFSLMKQKDKFAIARHFNLDEKTLTQYIKMLAFYRNMCAHDDRIYNAKLPKFLYIPDCHIHRHLNIPKNNDMYIYGKNDLFALTIILHKLLYLPDVAEFEGSLKISITNLKKNLSVLNIDSVLKEMKFPTNWENIVSCGNFRFIY